MDFREWLGRLFQRNGVAAQQSQADSSDQAPDGWTDDLSIELRAGRTVEELVAYVLEARQKEIDYETLLAGLGAEFGLCPEHSELALDRVNGGIVRAWTGNKSNCPDRHKDPIAYASFMRALGKK